MKKSILIFPDSIRLADFVLKYRIKGAEVQSCEQMLTAALSEEERRIALAEYGAKYKRSKDSSYVNKHFE